MKNAGYYVRILRPLNLIILGVTQILLKYTVFDYIFRQNSLRSKWSLTDFLIFVLITLIITASGNVINDYFDQKTDQLHLYKNNIIGQYISPGQSLYYYCILVGLGGILASYLAFSMDFTAYIYFYPIAVISLLLYSKYLKGTTLFGNILISLFTAFSCLILWLIDYETYRELTIVNPLTGYRQMTLICGFSLIVFLLNLSREIVKDIEDITEDRLSGINTTAVNLGIKTSKALAVTAQIALLWFLLFWSIFNTFNIISKVYCLAVLLPLLLLIIYKTIKAKEQKDYNKASSLHKVLMGTGLIYIFLKLYSI